MADDKHLGRITARYRIAIVSVGLIVVGTSLVVCLACCCDLHELPIALRLQLVGAIVDRKDKQIIGVSFPPIDDDQLKQWIVDLRTLHRLESISIISGHITDAGLDALEEVPELRGLSLDGTLITDDGLETLRNFTKLEYLGLSDTSVGDAGLRAYLSLRDRNDAVRLLQLRTLKLAGTRASDAALSSLHTAANLEELDLSRTSVTDDGLESLPILHKLTTLWVCGNAITDKGLAALARQSSLRELRLDEPNPVWPIIPKVTNAAIDQLKAKSPSLHVVTGSMWP
jgi:hypothetical protein